MELSRQMLLLTAENYGSYFLHITYNQLLLVPKLSSILISLSNQSCSPTIFNLIQDSFFVSIKYKSMEKKQIMQYREQTIHLFFVNLH